jgi:hypothetical protein
MGAKALTTDDEEFGLLFASASMSYLKHKIGLNKGLVIKRGPMDFSQSWAIYMKNSNCNYGEEVFSYTQCFKK